jgi:7tm Chemosensory receptor
MRNIGSTESTQHNTELRDLLQNFSLELVHQPVTFTVHGFYVINLSLLASIATGIVSYQILLIQFYASI